MNECPIYLTTTGDVSGTYSVVPETPVNCASCCNCGYLQYEALMPYLSEIKFLLKNPDQEQALELEFRLREQILEISRLFDMEAGVEPGYFSRAHYKTTKVFPTDRTKYLKIPEFVKGSLEIRTMSNYLLSENSYGFQDGYLVYKPCAQDTYCSRECGCGTKKRRKEEPWPDKCYKVT